MAKALPRANVAEFVCSDLSLDFRAIRTSAWSRFKSDQAFIKSYQGEPRRFWHRSLLARALTETFTAATSQRHCIIHDLASECIQYTTDEQVRADVLRAEQAGCDLGWKGSQEFVRISGELQSISNAAYRRAYDAVIAKAQRRPAKRRAA